MITASFEDWPLPRERFDVVTAFDAWHWLDPTVALDKAAAARRERAELKEKLKMGSVNLRELLNLADNNDVVAKMKVLAVLESLPGVGKVKARRTMDEIGISETRRVRGLGDQQRSKLLDTFAG